MALVLSVLWLLVVLVALLLILLALLLVAWLRIDGRLEGRLDVARLDEASGWLRLRVLFVALVVDSSERALVVRLAGLRVLRKPLAELGDGAAADEPGEAAAADEPGEAAQRPARIPRRRTRRGGERRRRVGRDRLVVARDAWHFYRAQLRHLLARVRLDHCEARARLATPDPALTGMLYGVACSVVHPAQARWPRAELHVEADFIDTAPSGRLLLAVRVRVATLARIAWRVFWYQRSQAAKTRKPKAADEGRAHATQ